MKTSLLWRMNEAPTFAGTTPPTYDLSSRELKELNEKFEANNDRGKGYKTTCHEIRKRIEALLPDINAKGSLYDFFQAFSIYSNNGIAPNLDTLNKLFGSHVDSWNEIWDHCDLYEASWEGRESASSLLEMSGAFHLFNISDRFMSAFMRELEISQTLPNDKLKALGNLADNPTLHYSHLLNLLRFVMAQRDLVQGPSYVVALGRIAGHRNCPTQLSKEIVAHILSCEAPLAAEDRALFEASYHPSREGVYSNRLALYRASSVESLGFTSDEVAVLPSLRFAHLGKIIPKLKTRMEAFRSIAPPPDKTHMYVIPIHNSWRHAQIAPTTADVFFSRIASNLRGFARLFKTQTGIFFYRQAILAAPIPGTDAYLVVGRGGHEAYTGIEIAVYPMLPFSEPRELGWSSAYLAKVQCIFGEDDSLDIVNIQGFGEKRLKTNRDSYYDFPSILKCYKELEALLKGAFLQDQLIALAIRLGTKNKLDTIRLVRDTAQIAYFENPHGGQGLYDKKASAFGFDPPQGRDIFHTLELAGTEREQDEPKLIQERLGAVHARRRGGSANLDAYSNIFLPAWKDMKLTRGPFVGKKTKLPNSPTILL